MTTEGFGVQAAMDCVDARRAARRAEAEKSIRDSDRRFSTLLKTWFLDYAESEKAHELQYAEKIRVLVIDRRLDDLWLRLDQRPGAREVFILVVAMAAVDGPGIDGRSPSQLDEARATLNEAIEKVKDVARTTPHLDLRQHLVALSELANGPALKSDDAFFGRRDKSQPARYFARITATVLGLKVRAGISVPAKDIVLIADVLGIQLETRTAQRILSET